MTSKNKELTIEEYKEKLLDDIEDTKELEIPIDDDGDLKGKPPKKKNIANRIINIVFTILVIMMIMISIDVVSVAKYSKGPFFAIKTNTYKDGGTKVYYGLGYKVIKYHQLKGRRDIEIGTWGLKYNDNPIETSSLDLAIEFTNSPEKAYSKYYKKFLKVSGIVSKKEKDKLVLTYLDEDGKYTLDIVCTPAEENLIPDSIKENESITVLGTLTDFSNKSSTKNKTLSINNCFVD